MWGFAGAGVLVLLGSAIPLFQNDGSSSPSLSLLCCGVLTLFFRLQSSRRSPLCAALSSCVFLQRGRPFLRTFSLTLLSFPLLHPSLCPLPAVFFLYSTGRRLLRRQDPRLGQAFLCVFLVTFPPFLASPFSQASTDAVFPPQKLPLSSFCFCIVDRRVRPRWLSAGSAKTRI